MRLGDALEGEGGSAGDDALTQKIYKNTSNQWKIVCSLINSIGISSTFSIETRVEEIPIHFTTENVILQGICHFLKAMLLYIFWADVLEGEGMSEAMRRPGALIEIKKDPKIS